MAESGYAAPSDRYGPHATANGFDRRFIHSIIQVAGAGFRLSLLLNGIASEIANADHDIRNVAKAVSLFSLMLKQVGKTMDEGKAVATQQAIETATEIKDQSEKVFEEIRGMVDFTQGRDEKGNVRSVTVPEKVKWCFKKNKVQYLLGQLESLKLSLSIMLQILQMGQTLAATRYANPSAITAHLTHVYRDDPSKPPLRDKALLQEKAEIQSMIVVQHWSLVELRKLYELAAQEAREEPQSPLLDDPPPSYDTYRTLEQGGLVQSTDDSNQSLSLHAPLVPLVPQKVEDHSQAVVKYQERPIQQLDASFNQALARENHVLHANVYDIVDHLLKEWTRLHDSNSHSSSPRNSFRDPRTKSYYESDTDDTSDSEFESSLRTDGRYLEAPRRNHKGKTHLRARVESDPEDLKRNRPSKRAPKKHVLHSDDSDTSSSDESDSPSPRPQIRSRRSSDANSHHTQDSLDRTRRPYMHGGLSNVPEDTSNSRPVSRGMPPSPMPVPIRPMATPNQQWLPPTPQGTPQNPGFRVPSFTGPPPGPPRMQSNGPYLQLTPGSPYSQPPNGYIGGPSPQPQPGAYFPPRMQAQGPLPSPSIQQRPPRHHRHHRHESTKLQREKEKALKAEESSKNLKRGLFGGAALAGVLDLLQGLDGM